MCVIQANVNDFVYMTTNENSFCGLRENRLKTQKIKGSSTRLQQNSESQKQLKTEGTFLALRIFCKRTLMVWSFELQADFYAMQKTSAL
jgi:hypothetical protein